MKKVKSKKSDKKLLLKGRLYKYMNNIRISKTEVITFILFFSFQMMLYSMIELLKATNMTINHIIIINIFSIILISLIGTLGLRNIFIKPLRQLVDRCEKVLQGDLTEEIKVKAVGEVDLLAHKVNAMTKNLRKMVLRIQNDTAELSVHTVELSSSNKQALDSMEVLATNAEKILNASLKQTTSIEDMQATLEEITASIEEINASTQQASAVATQATKTSQDGVNAVNNIVEKLQFVKRYSDKLHNIILLFNWIQKQSKLQNLLI